MSGTTTPAAVQAAAATTFDQSLGINTHIGFSWTPYSNLAAVQNALAYLGLQNVRDAIDSPTDLDEFAILNQDLGIKFDFFIAPGSAGMPWQLQQIVSDPGIVRFVEGANESDNWPQTYNGLTGLAATIAEQQALYATVKADLPGVPVIAPSFGWLSTFPTVGNLSAYADYANAHIYFGTGNNPGSQSWIQTVIQDAQLVAPGKPVMTTETGYYTSTNPADPNGVDPTVQAKYLLDDVMDQFKAGVSMDYLYELVDQGTDTTNPEDSFGLFTTAWTAKPAAVAIHNLMQLMQDSGAGGVPTGQLTYSLSGMPTTGNSELFEKSDGTFVLAVWNDTRLTGPVQNADIVVPNTPVTLTLGSSAARIAVFDPLTGTSAVTTASNVSQITLSVPDHPILIEIGPNAGAPPVTAATVPPPPTIPSAPAGVSVTVPGTESVVAGQTTVINGISIVDPWAAGMLGTMSLTLSVTSGTLTLTDAGGNAVAGSGTNAITVNGSLFQLNTDLAHLSYKAGSTAGTDSIAIDVWDPAGLEATQAVGVTIVSVPAPTPTPTPTPSPAPTPTPTPTPVVSGPVITAPASESVATGAITTIGRVSIADTFAATNPGSVVLNLSAGSGTLSITDGSGTLLSGSGTHAISITGSLSQINTDLAHLTYTAGASAGSDSVTVDIWDQAGMEATSNVAMTITAAALPPVVSPTPAPVPSPTTITIASTDASPVITTSNATVTTTSGNHQIFVDATGDTISATGGTEVVMAFQGGNTITTGAANDTIRIAGTGNVVDAGAGTNEIDDSGSGNTIVLTKGGSGTDSIFGYVLQNNDLFDLRHVLTGTSWGGQAWTAAKFFSERTVNGSDAVISVIPSGIAGGAKYDIATIHGSGPISVSAFLAKSIL